MIEEAIKEKLKSNIEIDSITNCWKWRKCKDKDGYGFVRIGGGARKLYRAHRISYELFIGCIPAQRQVLHKCDNPSCINPEHLFLGTQQDNMTDCVTKGRRPREEKHYKHVLDEDSVRTIRNLSALGLRPSDIGKQLGVNRGVVQMVVGGHNWKWVK